MASTAFKVVVPQIVVGGFDSHSPPLIESFPMNKAEKSDPRSQLPSVSEILEQPSIKEKIDKYSYPGVLEIIKSTLDESREKITEVRQFPNLKDILTDILTKIEKNHKQDLKPVVNATGIILHTGLGRAVLPDNAVKAISELNHCCNLQIDMETGKRGKRHYRTEKLLCQLTGSEAAHIVNNNAGATFLILAALCNNKEIIISRGQLIEIGGSYRLPDCIHQSGAKMVEVGTTNKTHFKDYQEALTENTGAILHVNPSNYHIMGFSKQVPIKELVKLKKEKPVIIIDDLGCGALENMEEWGLPYEPTAGDSITAGADLVCFSGDKLIGGAQAGIIVGKRELIDKIKAHPLSRMLRAGKLTDMVLEKTLRLFLDKEKLVKQNPTYKMLTMPAKKIRKRVRNFIKRISGLDLIFKIDNIQCESAVGGGSMPQASLHSWGLSISSDKISAEKISYLLRDYKVPIISYIEKGQVILDFRTVLGQDEEEAIIKALKYVNNLG